MADRPHGYARYKLDGCRCYTCAWAVAQYNDVREHAMRCGTWRPYVDAAPVRAHLLRLREAGLGLRQVAQLAGVDRKRLQSILNGRPERGTGPQEKCRPALVAKVLAVEPTVDNLPPSLPVDATGTRRRLQALVARGFPQSRLSSEMGLTGDNLTIVLNGHQQQVFARTARAVTALYARLWDADPAEHGATPGGMAHAAARARRLGWAPPAAWDDDRIDDPAAYPDWTGHCGTPAGARAHAASGIPLCAPCRTASRTRSERT